MFCVKNKLDILGGQGEGGSKKVFTFGFESKTNIYFFKFYFRFFGEQGYLQHMNILSLAISKPNLDTPGVCQPA